MFWKPREITAVLLWCVNHDATASSTSLSLPSLNLLWPFCLPVAKSGCFRNNNDNVFGFLQSGEASSGNPQFFCHLCFGHSSRQFLYSVKQFNFFPNVRSFLLCFFSGVAIVFSIWAVSQGRFIRDWLKFSLLVTVTYGTLIRCWVTVKSLGQEAGRLGHWRSVNNHFISFEGAASKRHLVRTRHSPYIYSCFDTFQARGDKQKMTASGN